MVTIAPGKHYQCGNKYGVHLVHLFFLIHSHIVNYHLAGEDSIINTLGTAPASSHSHRQNFVEYTLYRCLI
jgi:hypothetical protein